MNIVILKGRLTRDSEIREFQGGGKVLNNALALSRVWYDNNKNKHEETDFVDIKANNGTADFIAKWFKKGDGISVEGRLKQESWQDKDTGANRSRIVVIVESAYFELGNSNSGQNNAPSNNANQMAQNIANSGAVMGVSVTNYEQVVSNPAAPSNDYTAPTPPPKLPPVQQPAFNGGVPLDQDPDVIQF